MAIIERSQQLAAITALLDSARNGSGRIALLTGEAGIGKSALTRAFVAGAPPQCQIFWTACENFASAEPLGPLWDFAREAKWNLRSALEGSGGRLAAFSEALAILDDKDRVGVLVIEDAHWVDDATLDFVRYLGRRIHSAFVLLLITARVGSNEADSRLRRALADVPTENIAHIEVPALSAEAVRTLAQAAGRDGEAIYRLTAGNAFFVTELMQDDDGGALPNTIRDTVLNRAHRLSFEARTVLDIASIFSSAVCGETISRLHDRDSGKALDECVEHGLLTRNNAWFAFRHEIARQIVEGALPVSRRRELHRKAMSVLQSMPDVGVARLVHHAREANDIATVCKLAPIAAEQAATVSAHSEAVRQYETALVHASAYPPLQRASLYEKYAFECHLVGQMERAILAQKNALKLYKDNQDPVKEGDCLRWLSRLYYLAGNRIDAERFGREAVALLEELPGPELAMAYSNQSQLAMLGGDIPVALHFGHKAIALAEPTRLDRPDILCHALNNLGSAVHWIDIHEGHSLVERSLSIALAHNFQEHAARSYTNRAWNEIHQLANGMAETYLIEGINYCIERDLSTWRDYMRGCLADLLTARGRWGEATRTAGLVIDNPNAAPLARFPAVIALARIRTRQGLEASHLVDEATEFLKRGSEIIRLAPYAELVAERAWLGLADPSHGLAVLDRAIRAAASPSMVLEVMLWQRLLGAEGQQRADTGLPPPYDSLFAGDWEAAANLWEEHQNPYLRAIALLDGDVDAHYRAQAILDGLGAKATVERVRKLMRSRFGRIAHRGPRASTKANPAGLTRREMDVLRHIELGKSNNQIGETLFVSAKTVDHHISAILSKLDAKSRGEAVAIARARQII